jgi:ABC-2 type transport system permease protein
VSLRLWWVETRRFWARRAIVLGLLAALLLALIVNVVQVARSTADISYSRQQVPAEVVQGCRQGTYQGLPIVPDNCHVSFGQAGPPVTSSTTQFVDAYVIVGTDRRIRVAQTFPGTVRGVGIALTLLIAFLAATFVAADFGTSIGTQLLFEPRRRRMYVTKTLAVACNCFVVAVIVLVWCGLLQYAGASLRGITTGVDGTWLLHRAGDIGRASAASALMAVLAFAIGVVTRKTAAAIGTLFGLLIALQFLRHTFRTAGRITPVNAIWALADGEPARHSEAFLGLHTAAGAAAIAVAWAVAVTIAGALWFQGREIR